MFTFDVEDLFGGPGGWAEACRILGLREVGLEWDEAACRTRTAAGHAVIRTDVAAYPTAPFKGRTKGAIASPPCTPYSRAGKQLGLLDQPLVHQAVTDLARGRDTRAELLAACKDKRSLLAAEPMRWLYDLRPEWVAMEQVPDVLPLWQQFAQQLREWGYSAWCGILNAADYGVPQTRRRAILIASRMRAVAPPEPTHYDPRKGMQLWGTPWVSMAEALGWNERLAAGVINTRGERITSGGNEFSPSGPSWALTEKTRSWTVRTNSGNGEAHDYERDLDEPSPSVTSRTDRWKVDVGAGGFAQGYGRDIDEPSPTIRHQTESWVLRSGQSVAGEGRAERGLDEPAVSITGRADLCSWSLRNNTQANSARRSLAEPAGTLFFGARGNDVSWVDGGGDSIRIAVQEAAVLQSFRPDYPWEGSKTKKFLQIGNAVPPRLAAAVLGAATGIDWQPLVEREYAPADAEERAA